MKFKLYRREQIATLDDMLQKAEVKPYTRTRRGKFERVGGYHMERFRFPPKGKPQKPTEAELGEIDEPDDKMYYEQERKRGKSHEEAVRSVEDRKIDAAVALGEFHEERRMEEAFRKPSKAPTRRGVTSQRQRLGSELVSLGLVRGADDWQVDTQKDNKDGTMTLGLRATVKYQTPSHIEADVFSETLHKPVGSTIKVKVNNSTGAIVEVLEPKPPFGKIGKPWKTAIGLGKEMREAFEKPSKAPTARTGASKEKFEVLKDVLRSKVKAGEITSARQIQEEREKLEELSIEELKAKVGAAFEKPAQEAVPEFSNAKQVAMTILEQMGGVKRIQAMTGAKNFLYFDEKGRQGISFQFPNRGESKPNYVKVTLEPDDTYTVEFGRRKPINWRKLAIEKEGQEVKMEDLYKKLSEHTGIYFDQLQDLFERQTGLYLRLSDVITLDEALEKSTVKGHPRYRKGHLEMVKEHERKISNELKGLWGIQYAPRERHLLSIITPESARKWKEKTLTQKMTIIDNLEARGIFSEMYRAQLTTLDDLYKARGHVRVRAKRLERVGPGSERTERKGRIIEEGEKAILVSLDELYKARIRKPKKERLEPKKIISDPHRPDVGVGNIDVDISKARTKGAKDIKPRKKIGAKRASLLSPHVPRFHRIWQEEEQAEFKE